MNQLILDHLDARAWRAKPPGRNARTIAAIFAHVHSIRRKWLRLSAHLDHARCTPRQTRLALKESARRCGEMLAEALGRPQGSVTQFYRDRWTQPWPAGAAMFVYMIQHDAHHRGQVCLLAHQLGFLLPMKVNSGIWVWEKLWKECGFTRPR